MSTVAASEKLAVDIITAADMASVSASTIRRAIAAGHLRAAKLGAVVRIRPADIDAWLLANAAPIKQTEATD
jgi:excisionase family DNA binding protein